MKHTIKSIIASKGYGELIMNKIFAWLDNHEYIAGFLFGFLFVWVLWIFS